jgi:hypothetical protein
MSGPLARFRYGAVAVAHPGHRLAQIAQYTVLSPSDNVSLFATYSQVAPAIQVTTAFFVSQDIVWLSLTAVRLQLRAHRPVPVARRDGIVV